MEYETNKVRGLFKAVVVRAIKDYAFNYGTADVMDWIIDPESSFSMTAEMLDLSVQSLRELMLSKMVDIENGKQLYINGTERRMRW